jgi:hypothetical protein
MLLALLALALVAAALTAPLASRKLRRVRRGLARSRRPAGGGVEPQLYDPGRERRAEQRARELLCSCVNAEDWAMYRDLGFIRVRGRLGPGRADAHAPQPMYAYLIYPHKPIVAYVPETGALLSEYCVEFPDLRGEGGRSRLPASDDVLAKWMALTSDEHRVIRRANMHLVGRQLDPARVRRDLWRLAEWDRRRRRRRSASSGGADGGEGGDERSSRRGQGGVSPPNPPSGAS